MTSLVGVFVFGMFVSLLVAGGVYHTIYCFRRIEREMERGYGPHIAPRGETPREQPIR